MNKPAPVPVAPFPVKPIHLPAVFTTAGTALELFRFNRNLSANLGAVITAAVARSASPDDAARLLGLADARELFKVAARHKVKLPWKQRAAKKGGR